MADSQTPLELPAATVAEYLQQHPDFLAAFPELALQLQLPRAHAGTIQLAAYQLQVLRERNQALSRQLAELTRIATDNEQLLQRVQRLSLGLFQASRLEQGLATLVARLGEDFHVAALQLWLFRDHPELSSQAWLRCAVDSATLPAWLQEWLRSGEAWAGRLVPERRELLFGPTGASLQSVALLPLGDAGLLALGSSHPDHFQPGMGTVFLGLMGEALTVALGRNWEPG